MNELNKALHRTAHKAPPVTATVLHGKYMKYLTAAIVTILAGIAWASDPNELNAATDALYGRWASIEIGGKDAGEQIMTMSYEFRPDGTITITGDVKDQGPLTFSGTYMAAKDTVYIDLGGNVGSRTMAYSIGTNLILTISEPGNDAWVRLKKENAEQGVAGYPPQGVGSPER